MRNLTLLYGTETGNSAEVARSLARDAVRAGVDASVKDMASYQAHSLALEEDVLLIVSTTGEGDPPQPAARFFDHLEGEGAPKLDGVRYSVLALGDSAYQLFCEAGKRLDRRLEALGAVRLAQRVDCDIDYDEPARSWGRAILEKLLSESNPLSTNDLVDTTTESGEPTLPGQDKLNPVVAIVTRNVSLVSQCSTKETRHIELTWANADLAYEPGDAVGVFVSNNPEVASALLAALDFSPDTLVTLNDDSIPLKKAFTAHLEITTATPRFLSRWTALTQAKELLELARDDHSNQRLVFLQSHHVIDIVRKFPLRGLDPSDIITALRPLQPRLYSIASSQAIVPNEVHLTVAMVRYVLHEEPREGVATSQLAGRSTPGTALQIYLHRNEHFHLPADDVPIILIGAGTGVAPYRGFLQERKARGATGRSFLFFGERNRATDFLYRDEWDSFRKDGVLTRMEVAFSRDTEPKVYVQHRMLERAGELFAWIEEGAHLYVCGDATHLAPDVHETLIQIAAQHLNTGRNAAEQYVMDLQSSHRYHRDVY